MTALAGLAGSAAEGVGLKLLLSVLFLGAGALLDRLRVVLPGRRVWQLSDPSRVVISTAHSASVDTGEYKRPATGIGQVRALALLMPSLRRTYSDLKVSNIYLSSEPLHERLEDDLICLGSSKNNELTADLLRELNDVCPASFEGTKIVWSEAGATTTYEGKIEDGVVVSDFGLVIRTQNPFKPGRVAVILAGSHTFGTIIAARYFCEQPTLPFRRPPRAFVALVKAPVRGGHPSSPQLVREARLQR